MQGDGGMRQQGLFEQGNGAMAVVKGNKGVAGGKLRYDAIAMLLARRISLFVFCSGTSPGICPILALRSGNCGGKLPILPLLGNLEIGTNRIFHN